MSDKFPAALSPGRILVIDDEVDIRESLEALLTLEGFDVQLAPLANEGLRMHGASHYDLVLLDLMMPDRSGMEVIQEIRERDQETPIFLLTAYGSIEVAIQAIKHGANDYFSKPWDNEKLLIEIRRMIGARRLARENTELKRALKQRYSLSNIVGKSERMLKLVDLVGQVAPSRSNVLLSGETGTGKEIFAKAIHASSPRADASFISVNTSSTPAAMIDPMLFGDSQGGSAAKGYLESADKGTLFFDEIGALSLETQAKLLRVLQDRTLPPGGAGAVAPVDVRVLAASREDLRRLVEDGKFREDLYYRLSVISLTLPPLRDRKDDIPALTEHFFDLYSRENEKFVGPGGRSQLSFDPEAMQVLMEYLWPGNVRELENAVERAVVLASSPTVGTDVLPEHLLHASGMRIRRDTAGNLPPDASLFERVADFERRQIVEQLEQCNWSQTEAAEALRIPLSTLNQKIKRLSIDVKRRGA